MNINIVRYKFDELKELLDDTINLLVVAETKLDSTLNDNLFKVEGHKLLRRDQDGRGGGIMTLIPFSRRTDQESDLLENLCVEVHNNDNKWLIYNIIYIMYTK